MSNHIHIVLQQGRAPLDAFMQPLLCRVALAVRRKHDIDGHVFGRTYWDGVCPDPEAVRAIIDYIHNNPVKAGLCGSVSEWRWSSYHAYANPQRACTPMVEPVIDSNWFAFEVAEHDGLDRPAMDLRDLLMLALRAITDGRLTMTELRCMRGHEVARIRRQLIVRAAEAGYPGCAIARSLAVSESTVSKAIRAANVCRARLIRV